MLPTIWMWVKRKHVDNKLKYFRIRKSYNPWSLTNSKNCENKLIWIFVFWKQILRITKIINFCVFVKAFSENMHLSASMKKFANINFHKSAKRNYLNLRRLNQNSQNLQIFLVTILVEGRGHYIKHMYFPKWYRRNEWYYSKNYVTII